MNDPRPKRADLVIGWEEWLALPDLGLPAIRAKIDTGAKTSALHAFAIEPFGPAAAPQVRFSVHPVPGREDIVRTCAAVIADRREVTSSNGDKEVRFVIRTRLMLAGEDRGEIEATLTNRESMAYRMLLGRQAIRGGMLVDPAASFLLPKLSHRLYAGLPQPEPPRHRAMRIALLATRPDRPSNRLLQEEAEARGHSLDVLALDRMQLDFDVDVPRLLLHDASAPTFDAVLARTTGGPPGLAAAIVRHLGQAGAVTLNGADAMDRLRNPYRLATLLHAEGLPTRATEVEGQGRYLVIQGRVLAESGRTTAVARSFALRLAAALDLEFVAVDVGGDAQAPQLAGLDINPSLSGYGRSRTIARSIIAALEHRRRAPAVIAHGD